MMDRSCIAPDLYSQQDLIAYALGQLDSDLVSHLTDCPRCRAEVQLYRRLLALTREALAGTSARVFLVPCQNEALVEGDQCVADAADQGLFLTVERLDSSLVGRLDGCADGCLCWQDATVRLFGTAGFVVSSSVDANGLFRLDGLQPGGYTIGLVVPHEISPRLTIIGEFQLQ